MQLLNRLWLFRLWEFSTGNEGTHINLFGLNWPLFGIFVLPARIWLDLKPQRWRAGKSISRFFRFEYSRGVFDVRLCVDSAEESVDIYAAFLHVLVVLAGGRIKMREFLNRTSRSLGPIGRSSLEFVWLAREYSDGLIAGAGNCAADPRALQFGDVFWLLLVKHLINLLSFVSCSDAIPLVHRGCS